MKRSAFLIVWLSALFVTSCAEEKSHPKNVKQQETKEKPSPPSVNDTTFHYRLGTFETEVLVKRPTAPFKGTLLILQGWNFENTSWCENSDLCDKALAEGYYLVMPYMGKSIYHKKCYPETRNDWLDYPTRTWLMDTVCKELEANFGLFSKDHNNYVLGLSTGGRGALIIAEEYPDIFSAGASLSGDYDQSEFPKDNLYLGFFGANPENWAPSENPVSSMKSWKVPMYIGHGSNDSIVSVDHMRHLKELTDSVVPQLNFKYNEMPGHGHDYRYWGAEVPAMLRFFNGHRR